MAVTSRNLHPQPARRTTAKPSPIARPGFNLGIIQALWKPAIIIVAVYVMIVVANGQAQIWLDDVRYGRPRTMQIADYVGHNETNGQPSHFIALNLDRRVVVMELPGGDATKAQILQGPYLFGANENLTPVRLHLADVSRDNKKDLIISVKNEEIIYINTGDSLRLITAEERQQIGAAR